MINYRFLAMACQPLKLEGQSRTPNMRISSSFFKRKNKQYATWFLVKTRFAMTSSKPLDLKQSWHHTKKVQNQNCPLFLNNKRCTSLLWYGLEVRFLKTTSTLECWLKGFRSTVPGELTIKYFILEVTILYCEGKIRLAGCFAYTTYEGEVQCIQNFCKLN